MSKVKSTRSEMKRIIGRVARIHPASLEEAELLTDQAVSEIYELLKEVKW